MIFGIGTDIVQISRIEAALARHGDRFVQKILGVDEFEKYSSRKTHVDVRGTRFLATRFAAKEAFSKAIGLGMTMPMTWQAVQILNSPNGKPVIIANGDLLKFMDQNCLTAQVSISDEADYAVAFAIVEKK